MKNIFFLLVMIAGLMACDKDDDQSSNDPIDQLPKATQTGSNTVGCLVNGEAFLPKGGGLAGNKNCFYQYVEGGYYFGLKFTNSDGNILRAVNLFTKNSQIAENQTYLLDTPRFPDDELGKGGGYNYYTSEPYTETQYLTTPEVTGEMSITKLDFENHIVSGTFWFDAINEDGKLVEIREGRFDMNFTE